MMNSFGVTSRQAAGLFLVMAVFWSGNHACAEETTPVTATVPPQGINVRDYGASGSEAMTAGKIAAGDTWVEVADAGSFKPGQGVYLWQDLPEDGLVLADAGASDLTLECDLAFFNRPGYVDTHGGVVFRCKDERNFWIVYFAGFPACGYQMSLKKMVDGKLEDVGPAIGNPELPTKFHLKVVTEGNAVSVFFNDKPLGKTVEDVFCADQTQVGFFRHAWFNDIPPLANPWYAGGGTILYSHFAAGKLKDDFDRPNSWRAMGPPWKAVKGAWGIYEKAAFPFLAGKGVGLSTEIVSMDGNKIQLKEPFPSGQGGIAHVTVYHDDTTAIYRALDTLKKGEWWWSGNLVFPEGAYCISRPIYGNGGFGLIGVPSDQSTLANIKALPGFAPDPGVERFIVWMRDTNMGDKWSKNPFGDFPYESWNNNNFFERIERLAFDVIRPDTSPGVSGLGLGSSVNSYYGNLTIGGWRKRGVLFPQGSDNIYGVNLSACGNGHTPAPGPCFELRGTYSNTIILDNLEVTYAEIGVLCESEVWGCVINGVNAEMIMRPVVLFGCKAVTVKGINAGLGEMTDHAVVEIRGAHGAVEVDGTDAGYSRSVEVDGYTFGIGTKPGEFAPFHFTGGQDSMWFQAHHERSVHVSAISNAEGIGGEPVVVDEFAVGRPRSGSVTYNYAAVAGADMEEFGETGVLALLYVGKNVAVKKIQHLAVGDVGPDGLIIPGAEITSGGKVRLLLKGTRGPVQFLASRTQMPFGGPLPRKIVLPPTGIDLPLTAKGYLPAYLVAGPAAFMPHLTKDEILNVGLSVMATSWIDNESALRPTADEKVSFGGGQFTWTPAGTEDTPSLDLNHILGPDKVVADSIAYAITYVVAPRLMEKVILSLGVDDYARIYLNGTQVFIWDQGAGLVPDQFKTQPVTLQQGVNVLVIKSGNGPVGWGVSARFLDEKGDPIQDLAVRLTP